MPKMTRVIAVYQTPADARRFDDYYAKTHTPLAKKIPGLRRLEVVRVSASPTGGDIYQITQLFFDDAAARDRALGSPEAEAAVEDLANFAAGRVQLYLAEGGDV
jgi:uncharacterized protein (TIGR02118 family)